MGIRSARVGACAVVLLALAACGGTATGDGAGAAPAAPSGAGPLRVVASTTQVADFTRNVVRDAGDRVRVTTLLRPNIDPHDYEASPADVKALADADVLVINGVGLEAGWLDPAVEAAGFHGRTVDTSRGVSVRRGDGTDEQAEGDPHIWHDPQNAAVMVADITDALVAAEPADGAAFRAGQAAYTTQLDALDAAIRTKIDMVPVADRKLVTNHDAFGYYLQRYGLQYVGSVVPSFDTSAALSGNQINALVARIRGTGTRAVFSESSLPPAAAEALGRQAGVTVVAGEDSLYGDTLGPQGSAGATYLQMEQHNTDTIVQALRS